MTAIRIIDPTAKLGIFVEDWVKSLATQAASPQVISSIYANAVKEPLTVKNAGVDDLIVPRVVLLDLAYCSTSFAINEIPSATVIIPTGVISNDGDINTHWFARILKEFPNNTVRVRAKIYTIAETTMYGGIVESQDNPPYSHETLVNFEGYLTTVTSSSGQGLVINLSHILSALADSSSISSNIATATAGSFFASGAYKLAIRNTNIVGAGGGTPTIYGASSIYVGAGLSDRTDFWGYWAPMPEDGARVRPNTPQIQPDPTNVPNPQPGEVVFEQMGIHRFLYKIAQENLFMWDVTPNAAECDVRDTGNNGALYALMRLEPFLGFLRNEPGYYEPIYNDLFSWGYGGPFPAGQGKFFKDRWDMFSFAINNEDPDIVRRDYLIDQTIGGNAYYGLGYQYGMPIAFRTPINVPSGISTGAPLARSLMYELVENFGPTTMWDKLVNQILPNYLLTLVPMADRGLVVPMHSTPDRDWLTIYVDDIEQYQETMGASTPVRGTILLVKRIDMANSIPMGNDPSQVLIHSPGYDACVPGQFLFLPAPEWLSEYLKTPPDAYGATVAAGALRTSNKPETKKACNVAFSLISDLFEHVAGYNKEAPTKAIDPALNTATRYAKSLTAQYRLSSRSVHLKTYLRFDIAPGSAIKVEQPTDRAENRIIANLRYGMTRGIVSRVSTVIDSINNEAYTQLELMYARSFGESSTGPTVDSAHPVWRTAWYGAPLADSSLIRAKLGNRATLG